MKNIKTEIIGWYGVAAILTAYALASFKLVTTDNIVYLMLNLTGALGIISVAYRKKDVQPVVLNIVWALIALIAILRMLLSI